MNITSIQKSWFFGPLYIKIKAKTVITLIFNYKTINKEILRLVSNRVIV